MARSVGVVIPSRLNLILRATMLVVVLGLCACSTLPTRTATDYCTPWRPIYPSEQDVLTDGTARQIRDHDLTGAKLCGWKPKATKGK